MLRNKWNKVFHLSCKFGIFTVYHLKYFDEKVIQFCNKLVSVDNVVIFFMITAQVSTSCFMWACQRIHRGINVIYKKKLLQIPYFTRVLNSVIYCFASDSENIKLWVPIFVIISYSSKLSENKSKILKSARIASRDFTCKLILHG